MTLHDTTESLKKMSVGTAIGITVIILLVIVFNVGKVVKNILFPVKAEIANHTFGKVPVIVFPDNATSENLTYTINTESGGFEKFPDRLNVFKLEQPAPNFLNLDTAREKAKLLQFLTDTGEPIAEVPVGEATYEWEETRGLQRKLTFDIISFNFTLTSNYLTSLTTLNAVGLPDEKGAIKIAADMLKDINLLPSDIDLTKTESNEKKVNYNTFPRIYSIRNSELIPASSISNTQIIRVDLYQKDVEYELNTGLKGENSIMKKEKMKLPILYPNPPFSTISMLVGVGPIGPTVVESKFTHHNYIVDKKEEPTYSIKSVNEAFEELTNGAGYIAAYDGAPAETEILINKAYLAYYLGEDEQQYLMPIFVFEGDRGFFGYVSAVKNEWVE